MGPGTAAVRTPSTASAPAPDAAIRVHVLLFAGFREVVGRGELERAVAPGTTIRGLWSALCAEHPALERWTPSAALNAEWTRADVPLAEGDELAFLPPVAGG